MARTGAVPSPLNLGTSLVVKSLKKKKSWFQCNTGNFDDEPLTSSEPFVSLPVDPFARYTIPSRRPKAGRVSGRPPTPMLHFPSPPPRSPTMFQRKPLPSPPVSPTAWASRRTGRAEWTATSIQHNQTTFRSKIGDAKLTCADYICELDEYERAKPTPRWMRDDCSDHGTIFTLFGDAKDWDEFEEALFFLRPSKSGSVHDDSSSSSLPSSHPSSSSLAVSSSSSTSSVYSQWTTPATSCETFSRAR